MQTADGKFTTFTRPNVPMTMPTAENNHNLIYQPSRLVDKNEKPDYAA
jgi:hypothetical protein